MNRQQRRHPSYPALPLIKPLNEKVPPNVKIPPKKNGGKPDAKGTNSFLKGKKGE